VFWSFIRFHFSVPLYDYTLNSVTFKTFSAMSAHMIILYYAILGSTRVKNTKDKYTIKTYKNRELQNRQHRKLQQYTQKNRNQ